MPNDLRKEIYRSGMPDREAASAAARRDQKDRQVKTFMQFLSDEDEDMVSAEDLANGDKVKEDFAAPAAGTANTPGMGNVSAPSVGSVGSGDRFDNGKDEDEDEDEDDPNSFKAFIKKMKQSNGKS